MLAFYLILSAVIIIACIICNKISNKLGVPMLLAFIILGMIFGSDGLIKIHFDNFKISEQICSVALIFIMFYGGFGTNAAEAKPVASKSLLLSSLGTVITAGLVGLFCYFVLKIALFESFLIGSVISSTDAASVFSILRSKKLNLKYNTASLLEIESGSNDPFSYMLTVVFLSLMNGNMSGGKFAYMIFAQVIYGVIIGIAIAYTALYFLGKFKITAAGFDAIFIVAVALLSYSIPSCIGGNGYLSAYITGIILGNKKISNKRALVNFFDGITGLMQMLLFFLLGLLAFPSQLPNIALTALLIALFLTFIARPAAVSMILVPFKSPVKQQLLVSWSGMRGAASIVFAIMAVIHPATIDNDVFHIVFFIVLFSILLQGTLIPYFAKKLDMTDDKADVMKTFTDYTDEVPVQFIQFSISPSHPWSEKQISDILLPPECILVLIIREHKKIVPNGKTVLQSGDELILSGKATDKTDGVRLYEKTITSSDSYVGKAIHDIPSVENLIIMIKRNEKIIIPTGKTKLCENDVLVINEA